MSTVILKLQQIGKEKRLILYKDIEYLTEYFLMM